MLARDRAYDYLFRPLADEVLSEGSIRHFDTSLVEFGVESVIELNSSVVDHLEWVLARLGVGAETSVGIIRRDVGTGPPRLKLVLERTLDIGKIGEATLLIGSVSDWPLVACWGVNGVGGVGTAGPRLKVRVLDVHSREERRGRRVLHQIVPHNRDSPGVRLLLAKHPQNGRVSVVGFLRSVHIGLNPRDILSGGANSRLGILHTLRKEANNLTHVSRVDTVESQSTTGYLRLGLEGAGWFARVGRHEARIHDLGVVHVNLDLAGAVDKLSEGLTSCLGVRG